MKVVTFFLQYWGAAGSEAEFCAALAWARAQVIETCACFFPGRNF